MSRNSRRYRKPDLMFLVTLVVGLGLLVTSVVQAEPRSASIPAAHSEARPQSLPGRLFHAVWDLDLANKIKSWKPKIEASVCDDGIHLSRPFGTRGPLLQVSTSVPSRAERTLRAGGDSRIGTLSDQGPDAFLFLQKRW